MGRDEKARSGGRALNVALLLAVVVACTLLYALATRFGTPRADPLRVENPAGLVGERIQVEVLNGCGVDQLAARARFFLRDRGFDVVGVGNYNESDVRETFVIDRVGDHASAAKVAAVLGLGADRIRAIPNPDSLFDATVVLGADYATLEPFKN